MCRQAVCVNRSALYPSLQADPIGVMELDVVWEDLPVTNTHPGQLQVGHLPF